MKEGSRYVVNTQERHHQTFLSAWRLETISENVLVSMGKSRANPTFLFAGQGCLTVPQEIIFKCQQEGYPCMEGDVSFLGIHADANSRPGESNQGRSHGFNGVRGDCVWSRCNVEAC